MAVRQLKYPETNAAEWLFLREKAALHRVGNGT
jgi:hypothetical protein